MSTPVTLSTEAGLLSSATTRAEPQAAGGRARTPPAPGHPCRIVTEPSGDAIRLPALDHGEFLSPRLLGRDARHATVALVANRASVLAGDHVELDVDVARHTSLTLTEPAGTVAYDARGAAAGYSVTIRVGSGGALTWDAAPLVIAGGSALHREVHIDLEPGATLLMRDLLVLGRSYEATGGSLRSVIRARYDDMPLLAEDLDLRDTIGRSRPGMLERARVISTVMALGRRSEGVEDAASGDIERGGSADRGGGFANGGAQVNDMSRGTTDGATLYWTELAGPGRLARSLAAQAHAATAATDGIWQRCRASTRSTQQVPHLLTQRRRA